MAREIIHAGLHDTTFIERGTTGFEAYRKLVEPYTLEFGASASPAFRPTSFATPRISTPRPTAR